VSFIVKIIHNFNNKIEGDSDNPILLLSNNKGSYFSISSNQTSYQGLTIFKKGSMYKIVDAINFSSNIKEVVSSPKKITITRSGSSEDYFLGESLICNIKNHMDKITIDLDSRFLYNAPSLGRVYETNIDKNIIFIRYKKYSDSSLSKIEDNQLIGIRIDNLIEDSLIVKDNWLKKDYSIDKKRGYSSIRFVNNILSFKLNNGNGKIIIAYGDNEQEIIEKINLSINKQDIQIKSFNHLLDSRYKTELSILSNSLEMNIHNIAIKGKHSLKQIFAGWPWFFQFWTRDTLISLGSLILMEKYSFVKDILDQYLNLENNKGLIDSRIPSSQLKAIDSTGWLFKRYYDFIYALSKKRKIVDFYDISSLKDLKKKLEKIFDDFIVNNMKNGLIYSAKDETWMDTAFNDAGREGFCIEIQALTLAMIKTLRLISLLTDEKLLGRHKETETKLLINVRKRFVKNGVIADFITNNSIDSPIRPNIFLARYIYPHLFSNVEWKATFEKSLEVLWLKWGGLSSIDKNNSDFVEMHTGSDNKSYHRGDSWYFINNIVATQLFIVDKNEFAHKIRDITDASIKDLFFTGVIGGSSEISSAKFQTSEGCLNQSWSSATLIELIYLLDNAHSFLE
jgi:glycogen debranching enzyme